MKQELCWITRIIAVITLFITLSAAAVMPPEVSKGLSWLQTQVQSNGSLNNENTSLATILQNRSETLHTLKLLASAPSSLIDQVNSDLENNTEYLSRRIVSLSLAGIDSSATTRALLQNQSFDGGFAGTAGESSSLLDTAWAVIALSQGSQINSSAAQNARAYLIAALQSDGSIGIGTESYKVQQTAMTLLALQMSPQNINTSNTIKQTSNWLQLKQQLNGSWLNDSYLSALTLTALSPLLSSDSLVRSSARNYLMSSQKADGSWATDPFVTAVVLRALSNEPTTTSTPATAISGQVIDQRSSTPLSGAIVTLGGTASTTFTTGMDGRFNFSKLAAGNYTLAVSKNGYNAYNNNYQLNAGQNLDTGAITLSQLPTTGIVRGQISAAGVPLAGASIQLNGTQTTNSDANGAYELSNIAPGAITLSVSKTGYQTSTGSANLQAGYTLVFSPTLLIQGSTETPTTGHFKGKVIASNGAALANVSITANNTLLGKTASDGSFDLVLTAASYATSFTLSGYTSASTNLILGAGSIVDAGIITLAPNLTSTSIHGIISDASTGKPINAAQIQIIDGAVVSTVADGAYNFTNLTGNSFNLRISATGYTSQTLQLQVDKPSDINKDFALILRPSLNMSLSELIVNPSSAASQRDISINTTVTNQTSGDAVAAVLTLQVINQAGVIVSEALAYQADGITPLGILTLNSAEQRSIVFRWNTKQFPAGNYQLLARIVEAGSITQKTPLGRVIAEVQGSVNISPTIHFTGTISADPPVLQINTNTAVHLSAVISSDGNTPLPAQSYQLQVIDDKTNTVIATQQRDGNALNTGELQTLNFADWMPVTGGGNYRLELTAINNPDSGKISNKLYVGDAATANYTVNKLVVPAGTQSIKGNIKVLGQDATLGTISDPLAPLIKTAIQKAVTYNDAVASSWYNNNQCLGCHVVSQALVGGELNRKVTTFDATQRQTLFNALVNHQQSDGSIWQSHPEYARSQTILGAWALSSWNKKEDIVAPMAKVAHWLIQRQDGDGGWSTDHASGWWPNRAANTGITLKTLVETAVLVKQFPNLAAKMNYLETVITGNQIPGDWKGVAIDAAGNMYVTSHTADLLSRVDTAGNVQTLLNISTPRPPIFAKDGALYIPSNNAVTRYELTGKTTTLSNIGATNLVEGPDGNIYASNSWHHKISKITPDGNVSDFIVGDGLYYPHAITFDQNGMMLVGDANSIRKYNTDKTFTVVAQNAGVASLLPYNNNILAFSSPCLQRYNSNWQGEIVINNGQICWSIAKDQNGQLFVGSSNNTLYRLVLDRELIDVLSPSIAKATNWLLQDPNTDNNNHIDVAMRLIGLGSAKQYYAGTAMETTVQSKMQEIGTLLRSRQRDDGGWGRYSWDASDSMVTAMVGVALDYLKPSPQDPVVQNAIKFLLSRQAPDGSWLSENRVLETHLAATTWVAIWLPIALDRIAGIDTDLTLSMPANVSLSNPSIPTTSSTSNAAGGMDHTWKLQGVTAAGQNINFDLTLTDMGNDETRSVASEAYLTFNNSFTNSKVKAPINVPRVNASAYLTLGVTTDKTSYPANTPVNITAMVNNTGSSNLSGSVGLEIYAADNTLVANLGTQNFSDLAANAQYSLGNVWNTSTTRTGVYRVVATLYDAANRKAGTAQSSFDIVGNSSTGTNIGNISVSAGLVSDKPAYNSNDNVQLTARITNLTKNASQSGIQALISVYRPDGSLLWSQTRALSELLSGAYIQYNANMPLSNAPVGTYQAVLTLANTSVRIETSFNVLSSAMTGSGLSGTLSAQPKQVPLSDAVAISFSLKNQGNAELLNLASKVVIVDPVTSTVMHQRDTPLTLGIGQTSQQAYTWNTSTATVGKTYVASLIATVAGKDIPLASDNFQVIAGNQIKLDVSQTSPRYAHLLIWLACDSDDKLKEDESERKRSLCQQTRSSALDKLLTSLNIEHQIVTTRDAFRNAMRTGRYNIYWLSGKGNESENAHDEHPQSQSTSYQDIARELRAAVYRGDGLIIDGKQPGLPQALQQASGIQQQGQHNDSNLSLTTLGQQFPSATLATLGRAQKMQTSTGKAEANFAPINKKTWPAIISNHYGNGNSLTFAFDLTDSLANSNWQGVFAQALNALQPAVSNTYSAGAYVQLNTQIKNLAQAVDINLLTYLPQGSTLIQSNPSASLTEQGQPNWNIHLNPAEDKTYQLSLRLPDLTGNHIAASRISYNNGTRYGDYSYTWTVAASDRLYGDIRFALQQLKPSKAEERQARDAAIVQLEQANAYSQQAQYEKVINALLNALDQLSKISSVDSSIPQQQLTLLLQESEWKWSQTATLVPHDDDKHDDDGEKHEPKHHEQGKGGKDD